MANRWRFALISPIFFLTGTQGNFCTLALRFSLFVYKFLSCWFGFSTCFPICCHPTELASPPPPSASLLFSAANPRASERARARSKTAGRARGAASQEGGGGGAARRAGERVRACVGGGGGGGAHGDEAAASPAPRQVGGARGGAGRGGVHGGGTAARRRRFPLLPVAAARRRRRRGWRPPCCAATEPAVPGNISRIKRRFRMAEVVDSCNGFRLRFHLVPFRIINVWFISCPFPPSYFSEQLNKPSELRRNVVGTVDFAVPVSAGISRLFSSVACGYWWIANSPNWFWIPQSGGSKLGEELWASKLASNFFGCSNATKAFAGMRYLQTFWFCFRVRKFLFGRRPELYTVHVWWQ